MARILFVEPFYGGSHKAFADGLVTYSKHKIELLTLPGERWRQRMRLGSQQIARKAAEVPGDFDAIVATDMLDLPAFLALTRPRFDRTPVLVYFHENQFTYPRIRGTKLNSWFGQINYLSALTSDRVAFNSGYHRRDFLDALRELEETPTNWLDPAAIDEIAAKSTVLPVGVDFEGIESGPAPSGRPPLILWNHRWEFDKAPAVFARAMERLAATGLAFEVAVAGSPGETPSDALEGMRVALGDRVIHFGHCEERAEYHRLLRNASIVVSTARHEFFGIGMAEAMHAGCVPVAPNGLNYPALVPEALHQTCLFDDEAGLDERLAALVSGPLPETKPLRESAARFAWPRVAAEWDVALDALVGGGFSKSLSTGA